MRYLVAILATCLVAGAIYFLHYTAVAYLRSLGAGPDTKIDVPYRLQILFAMEHFLFTFRFVLVGLFLIASLGIALVLGKNRSNP